MGNTQSSSSPPTEFEDIWWTNGNKTIQNNQHKQEGLSLKTENPPISPGPSKLQTEITQKLDEFKLQLGRKHEKRRQLIAEKRKEMQELRDEVLRLRKENHELKEISTTNGITKEIERLRKENELLIEKTKSFGDIDDIMRKNRELKMSIAEIQAELQNLNTEVIGFEKEREEYKKHVIALKDVIKVSKEMILMKEKQMTELKQKVDEIEASLEDKEMCALSQNIRAEYEKQLENMRNLRLLYDERQRANKKEKEELQSLLSDKTRELEDEQKKTTDLQARIEELETDNSKKYDEIKSLESNLGLSKAESRQYQAELTVINQLFSQILLGFNNSQEFDIDKLIKHLEENHDLLQNIVVNEVSNEVASALPKVLLDLLYQINEEDKSEPDTPDRVSDPNEKTNQKLETIVEESESQTTTIHQFNSAEEIVENLPKVWRVLIELLSHQSTPVNIVTNDDEKEEKNPCYKLVDTPKGPNLVLSVSQTFIRLKDLILEKKSLEKETLHLKQLNTHLESRLQDQEKRLEVVTSELSKTWHVVGKLQKQHHLLHTQEKILRYELAQKRKLLTELKEELEYSREKWLLAREKNSTTEEQWKQLRTEFASRKTALNDDLNNSVESGYSDERESDDEPGYETDVSEGNPKSELETIVTDRKNSIIMEVVHNEIAEIVGNITVEDEVVESNEQTKTDDLVQNTNEKTQPSTSTQTNVAKTERSLEEVLTARQERLDRLEGQCQSLVKQVINTSSKSVAICNKLENLHEIYGESSGNRSRETGTSDDENSTEDNNTLNNQDNQE